MRVFVCRHGETIWNARGKVQGIGDSPLTENGIEEAKAIALLLAKTKPKAIYCSASGRAVKTAEIIARKHKKKPVEVKELHEIDAGKFEGLTMEERAAIYKALDEERKKDKYSVPFPCGENYEMVKERLKPFVETIKKKHAKEEVIVVAHQSSGKTLVSMLAGLGNEELLKLVFPHDLVFEITITGKEAKIGQLKVQ